MKSSPLTFYKMSSTKNKGDEGELVAIKYLQNKGYSILDYNFKFGRFGEIDIIANKLDIVHFIEVKFRTNLNYGYPEDSITKNKLFKFKKTIEYYVVKNKLNFEDIQFDVISIIKGNNSYKLKHYKKLEI